MSFRASPLTPAAPAGSHSARLRAERRMARALVIAIPAGLVGWVLLALPVVAALE